MEGFIHELILCCWCLMNDCQQSLSAASDCNPCCDNLIVSVLAASVSQNTTNNLISKLNFKVKFISYKTKLSGTGNELVSVTFSSVSTIYNLHFYIWVLLLFWEGNKILSTGLPLNYNYTTVYSRTYLRHIPVTTLSRHRDQVWAGVNELRSGCRHFSRLWNYLECSD